MTADEVAGVAAEVDARRGDRVRAVHQDGPDRFRVALEGDARLDLVLDLEPDFPRVHLASPAPAPGAPTPLAAALRNLLSGARLEGARAVRGERALEVRFSLAGLPRTLWFEGFGRHANWYALDEAGAVAATPRGDAALRREAPVGRPFRPVPPREDVPAGPPSAGTSEAVAAAALEAAAAREERAARAALERRVEGALRKARSRVRALEEALAAAGEAAVWQRRGELLQASFHLLAPGLSSVRVPDFASDPPAETEVPLDPRREPGENVAACFARARKVRRGEEQARARLPAAREREARLAAALEGVRGAADAAEALRTAADAGLGGPPPPRRREEPGRARPWREFESADGWRILVGRDARGNDELTLREARPGDLFLHVRGAGGSHVVVPTPRGKTVPKETLLDAAELACFFSARREAPRAEVDYAERRHVRKPRGAPPGLVQLDRSKTLTMHRDEARRGRLLGRSDGPPGASGGGARGE